MEYCFLNKVNSPTDLKKLSDADILKYIEEVRAFLIETVEKSGGHLASNLGACELSVAIHRVFNSPSDKIIFDVGHQSYVHKLITGRRADFDNLRIPGGLSGFTTRRESAHDPFGAGHSSTSISAALGFAEANKLAGKNDFTVAVIGDGAYTGGMVHEAINNLRLDLNLVIIINENGMSISGNKGAFASYLSRVRASRGYRGVKRGILSFVSSIPILGKPVKWVISNLKRLVLHLVFVPNYFEELGFYYLGSIDGNDYKKVEEALAEAKRIGKTCFVHLITKKGRGYNKAEEAPEKYHSIPKGNDCEETFHSVFANELLSVAKDNKKTVAVTAGMAAGTGLDKFESEFPDRFFDVGIAEDHALTFSAGLAAAGLQPYAAIYSTFLQRGYDSILHDIALQSLPVRIFVDRAGISRGDGATHHGIFDVAFLSHIPGIKLYAPATFSSLKRVVRESVEADGPFAVRYANSSEKSTIKNHNWYGAPLTAYYDFDLANPPENIFITYGNICDNVIKAQQLLFERGIPSGIILVEELKPYNSAVELILKVNRHNTRFLYVEEGILNGGAASITLRAVNDVGVGALNFKIAAIDDSFLIPDIITDIYDFAGLSPEKLAGYFLKD